MRHRWIWNESTGSGKCKHCGAKTALIKAPDKRPGRKGKVAHRMYQVGGAWVIQMPECKRD